MKKLALVIGGAAASVLLATGTALADHGSGWGKRTIEGAWEVTTAVRMDADDCTTAPLVPVGPNPFPAFNTFHEGGTMSEWGTRSPPADRTSGHGVWERIGHNRFGYRLMFHSFRAGALDALMDIRTKITLSKDGETFTGVSRFVRTPFDDGPVLNFCATMEGRRISF